MSALNHPNILTIHEIGESDGIAAHYIATEYVEGQTLRSAMSCAKMELCDAVDVAIQAASALSAAHQAGIVHSDIKPENIMLRPDGYVKVLDFGLAKLCGRQLQGIETHEITLLGLQTQSGMLVGTPKYMSPEQVRGLGVDERTDIFSFGILVYEMIAGRVPFEGSTLGDVIVSILEKEPSPLKIFSPGMPGELQSVVSGMLCKDRDGRYQTVKEVLTDLRSLKPQLEAELMQVAAAAPPGLNNPAGLPLATGKAATDEISVAPSITQQPRMIDSSIEPDNRRFRYYLLLSLAIVAVIGVLMVFVRPASEPRLTTAEFADDFELFNPNRWSMPRGGWTIDGGRLHLENAAVISFPNNISYRDFVMMFHLKLTNAGGAAWAVHVRNAKDYYLFYLSGPEGLFPGRFNTYIIRGNTFDPTDYLDSQPALVQLRAQGEYQIQVTASSNAIEHKIIPADTGEQIRLGLFKDPSNTLPFGSVGFRTIGAERFSIDELYVLPPDSITQQ